MIIKHAHSSLSKPDQTSHTVLNTLHKEYYREQDGWKIKTWTANLTLPNEKKEPETKTHTCKYLIHEQTGYIITSQYKAWNDTVRMCMWVDLVLIPAKDKRGGKLLLWMDNCGIHHTDEVEKRMKEGGIKVFYFPPNMTAVIQPLDLVVNGPIKRHVRGWTADRIATAFWEYRARWKRNEPGLGKFKPPKHELHSAMARLFDLLFDGELATDAFKNTVRETFVKCGMTPCSEAGEQIQFEKFDNKKLAGVSKYAPPESTIHDLTQDCVIPVLDADQDRAVADLIEGYVAGEYDDDSDDDVP